MLLLLLGHVVGFYEIPFLNQLEEISYDSRVRLTAPNGVDPRIVIVDIDEKSLSQEGHWPWGRNRLALMMDRLFNDYRASVVGFDVVFAEQDNTSGIQVLTRLAQDELKDDKAFRARFEKLKPKLDNDHLFAKSLQGKKVALGYYFNHANNLGQAGTQTSGMLPSPVITHLPIPANEVPMAHATGYGGNIPELQDAAMASGHFNPQTDVDGVVRRVPMLIEFAGAAYESLSLAVVRLFLGTPKVDLDFQREGDYVAIESLHLGNLLIPVDEETNALVPYRGRQGSFRYISAIDILNGRLKPGELNGCIVLVGTTAPGLQDLRSTPVQNVYPGVEVHANMIAGILDQNIKHRPGYVLGFEVLGLLALGVALAAWVPFLSARRATLVTATMLALVIGSNLAAWQYAHLVLPLASGLMLIFTIFVIDMAYGFFIEDRAKRQVSKLFGQYVPPELVEELSQHPDQCNDEGESRNMTVLFSDVRNFTKISEGLEPARLSRMMNTYLTAMTRVIQKHRGTIDKYIGDAVMAFWGAPLEDKDHARHALLAAMEMQEVLVKLMPRFKAQNWPKLSIGVGINSGIMNVGNMGSEFRRAYTVLGDNVNLASRLEGLTKQYGVGIIVGEDTKQAVPEVIYREIDRVRVKGKQTPVSIFEPVGLSESVDSTLLERVEQFHGAVAQYRVQEWDTAETTLKSLLAETTDHHTLYQLYLDRIAQYRADPPGEEWGGVFEFQIK